MPGEIVGKGIASIMGRSARHRWPVFLACLAVMFILSAGLKNTEIDQELSDGLPESNPNKRALDRVMDRLPGISTLEAVLLELDDEKTDINDIRDQDSIRAIEFVYQWVKERVPELSGGVSLNHVVKQVRVVVNNNDPAFFELPPNTPAGRAEFDALWSIANNTVKSNIELTIRNPDYQSSVMAIQYDTKLDSDQSKAIGYNITQALGEYRKAALGNSIPQEFNIFKEEYVYNVGPQSGLLKFESHMRSELPYMVPFAFAFIFVALMIGLRSPRTALVGISMLFVTTISTVGLLGWLKIPFTSANITMVPLIVGNGIDYAIHVLNEYTEERSKGSGVEDSFRGVGHRAGVAMILATTTSVTGLASMLLATSISLRQLAISCIFALLAVTILAITYLPAAVAIFGRNSKVKFHPSNMMAALYRLVNRRKAITIVVFLLTSLSLSYNVQNLDYFRDITSSNFPDEDQFVQSYNRLRERQRGSADELLIIEGDITSPETLAWIRNLEEDLMTRTDIVASRAHVNSLTVLLGAYEILTTRAGGLQGAAEVGIQEILAGEDPQSVIANEDHVRNAAPKTKAEIERDIVAMQSNVAWRPLIDFLYSKDGSITIIDVLVDDGNTEKDFKSMRHAYDVIQDVIHDNKDTQPDDVDVHLNGLSSGLYFFLDYSFTWLRILLVVSAISGSIIMFLFTRSIRAVVAFVTPMLFTTTWVLGILPMFGILVGAGLILPLIFITSIGSDYAAHLIWDNLREGHPEHTYKTAGKGILFSAITDFGAFFIFSFSYLKTITSTSLATSLSIVAIFFVTMLTVPLFFNRERREEPTVLASP